MPVTSGPDPQADTADTAAAAAGFVLLILCAGQFLMTLDSSVMNVSIAQVASDLGTTVTGIQTAITLYTLVMATLMITGGKIGSMIGRRKAFAIGCVIYACGSGTTALAPNLTVLIIGWSFLEGIGAALIMPAIVALVASNFEASQRPRAYGLVASAGAIAVAAGPLIGGAVTTLWTWRLVFAGEVVLVAVILLFTRRIKDTPPEPGVKLDVVGVVLSAAGLGMAVFGVLRSSEWGWVQAKPDAPALLGISMTVWLILGGLVVLRIFFWWQQRRTAAGLEPLVDVNMLKDPQLRGGLTMFFFQFLLQAGLFFTIPLFLSVALGLSAFETGVRLLPLSVALLAAAVGIPKFWPKASPRLVVTIGIGALLAGIVALILALDVSAEPEVVTVPLFLAGIGVGALASQLGAVTVSSVPDELTRRGRWPPEHRHQPRCLPGHRRGRLGADRCLDRQLPHRRPGQPGHPVQPGRHGRDRAGRRDPVHVDGRPRDRAGRRGRGGRRGGRDRRGEREGPDHRTPGQPRRPGTHGGAGAVLHPGHPHGARGSRPGVDYGRVTVPLVSTVKRRP